MVLWLVRGDVLIVVCVLLIRCSSFFIMCRLVVGFIWCSYRLIVCVLNLIRLVMILRLKKIVGGVLIFGIVVMRYGCVCRMCRMCFMWFSVR